MLADQSGLTRPSRPATFRPMGGYWIVVGNSVPRSRKPFEEFEEGRFSLAANSDPPDFHC
jgi:hypothetical protein